MKPLVRNIVRTDELLDHAKVEDTHNQFRRDARDIVNRRYMRTPCIIPFGPFDNTAVGSYSGLANMIIKPPFATMLRGVEVVANFTTGGSNVMTISATGIDGWEDIEVTSTAMNTDAIVISSRDMRIDAAQEVVITASFDNATYTVERLEVTLWVEADRLQDGTSRPLRGATNTIADAGLVTGDTTAADLNAIDTDYDNNFNASTGAEKQAENRRLTRITVHVRADNTNTVGNARLDDDFVPGGGLTEVYSWDHYATGTAANNSDVSLDDEGAADVFNDTLVYATTTAKNQGNVINEAIDLDPANPADFYTLTFDDGLTDVGADWRQVVVLYWI